MTFVKFCGLMDTADIEYVNETRPDMAGLILTPGFRRSVDIDIAEMMLSELDMGIKPVGVFVDEDLSHIMDMHTHLEFDIVQLHGNEDNEYIDELKDSGVTVIKSFGITNEQLEMAKSSSADMVLIDPGKGSGEDFDVSILKGFGKRFILAGGLTPENVKAKILGCGPYGVDTSSGIEVDGRKDREKMRLFIQEVRAADKEITI